jgi:outer membrane protein OmpA-like peptidoglycan-associated protein
MNWLWRDMTKMRRSHLVIGVAVVVMGYALTIIALARQAERATATGPVPTCSPADSAARAPVPSPPDPGGTTLAASANAAGASAPMAGSASASSLAAPAPSGDALGDSQESRLFKFSPGGAVMSREEVLKMLALGKALARHPTAKVSIEGFGDLAGSDPLMVGIGKHRAKVAQTLLSKAGVTEDRVTLTFSDMGADARLARSIRVTTTPPISEVEKP